MIRYGLTRNACHPDVPGIEEYHATPEGYLRTATVKAGQPFQPGVFPDLRIDLKALTEGPETQQPQSGQ